MQHSTKHYLPEGSSMSVGDLRIAVERASAESPLGDDTIVVLCAYEREYESPEEAFLEIEDDLDGDRLGHISAIFAIKMGDPEHPTTYDS